MSSMIAALIDAFNIYLKKKSPKYLKKNYKKKTCDPVIGHDPKNVAWIIWVFGYLEEIFIQLENKKISLSLKISKLP